MLNPESQVLINTIITNLAIFTTILQFLSGILVCKQYVENRTTGESTPLPFLCGILSTCLWLVYGLIRPDNNIVFVNTVGLVLMSAYTIVFYIYTVKKWKLIKESIIVGLFISCICGYSRAASDHEVLVEHLGLLACSLTLVTIAAPMVKLLHVVRTKNTECLPFPMILMSFFVSCLWYTYGVYNYDKYITLPNFIGGALAVSQLSLFVIYPRKPTTFLPSYKSTSVTTSH